MKQKFNQESYDQACEIASELSRHPATKAAELDNFLKSQEIYQQIIAKQDEITALIEQLQDLNPELIPAQKKPSKRFKIPSIREIKEHIDSMGFFVDAEQFHAFYSSKDWYVGKNKMKNWKAALVTWNKNSKQQTINKQLANSTFFYSMNSQDF